MHEDQATRLRQMMNQPHRVRQTPRQDSRDVTCRTIAVCSGKGGVGKSNVALNLAIQLSMAGNRVALVDADMGLANLDVLINVDVRGNLSHVVAGQRSLDEIVVDLPSGVQFIAGASGLAKMANLSEFERVNLLDQLTRLEMDNDFIVIDCGAGIGPDVLSIAGGADNVLVVTTPEPTAITDAYAVIKVLAQRSYSGTMSLLVNLADSRQEARATFQRIADVARRFLDTRVYDGGYVSTDMRVREAVKRREPFVLAYPKSQASKCVAALVNRLSAGGIIPQNKTGFFKRVARLFA